MSLSLIAGPDVYEGLHSIMEGHMNHSDSRDLYEFMKRYMWQYYKTRIYCMHMQIACTCIVFTSKQ